MLDAATDSWAMRSRWCTVLSMSSVMAMAMSIHGVNVTDICAEAYRAALPRTANVTAAVVQLAIATSNVPALRIPGMAAAKSAAFAQQIFTRVSHDLERTLTDDDKADLIQARNQETGVSIYLGLVEQNSSLLNDAQKKALQEVNIKEKAEQTSKQLASQACPELGSSMSVMSRYSDTDRLIVD